MSSSSSEHGTPCTRSCVATQLADVLCEYRLEHAIWRRSISLYLRSAVEQKVEQSNGVPDDKLRIAKYVIHSTWGGGKSRDFCSC